MLEVFSKYICHLIMSLSAFYVIKCMTNSKERLFTIKTVSLIVALTTINYIIDNNTYSITSTLLTFLINTAFYKLIFNLNKEESIICCGIYMIILFFSDTLYAIFVTKIFTIEELRSSPALSIISNLIDGIIALLIINIKMVKTKCIKFLKINQSKRKVIDYVFILFVILCFVLTGYNIRDQHLTHIQFSINIGINLLLLFISYVFIIDKVKYNQLIKEYNVLFNYIQNFEEWVEKEQLNRHEYKNQLAILRSLATDEKVIKKINNILDDNIKIKDDVVYKLRKLPKGGLKGLMYYKVALAQKQNINIEVDVSLKEKGIFGSLSENKMKVLCNLIGIYFDNAIEATIETAKKSIELEVYELNNEIRIVISNTFVQYDNFDKRNERGVTTKGKGHGNGLYYANNLLSKNDWIDAVQETIDDYYIQNIIIKKTRALI